MVSLMADYHKCICMMKYNFLTLPKSVQFRRGDRIEYVYDAAETLKQVNNYYPSGTSMAERRTDQAVQPSMYRNGFVGFFRPKEETPDGKVIERKSRQDEEEKKKKSEID